MLCGVRPRVLTTLAMVSAAAIMSSGGGAMASSFRMPDEGEPHAATWMAFAVKSSTWGGRNVRGVEEDLAGIAAAIAAYEPVKLLVDKGNAARARALLGGKPNVELVEATLDDLWMRDSGPVFVKDEGLGVVAAVGFNFNGWGNKQRHKNDAKVAGVVAGLTGARRWVSRLVMEGGAIEVDGRGTAIATESSIVNSNRNPGLTRAEIECQLKADLGLRKIIWLPGVKGADITDAHIDFYARFAGSGRIVLHIDNDPKSPDYDVTRENSRLLQDVTDADGKPIQVVEIAGPDWSKIRVRNPSRDFCTSYLNYYVLNGALLVPQFGDAQADTAAQAALRELYPERDIVALNIDNIASGGGGIHCTTQQQPAGDLGGCAA